MTPDQVHYGQVDAERVNDFGTPFVVRLVSKWV
jgi:hypothetical protein